MTAPPVVQRKIDALPDLPGVYLWKNAAGEVVYVGKARRLRQRVRNYFASGAESGARATMLRRSIADLETIVVKSDAEALLLENNLIKEYRPRFNVALRDDKSYPAIAVTLDEPFPRVLVVRRQQIPGARYFGPYTDVTVLRRMLRVIRRIFTVRSCHYALPEDAPERPCLDYHIHRCLAPCVGYQSRDDYRKMIGDVVAFLEGRTVDVRQRLRARMEEAASRMDFERAAEIRDSIGWLDQVERPQSVELVGGGDADAIGFARDGDDAVGVVLRVRAGRVLGRDQRFLENLDETSDAEILAAFLVRHYLHAELRAGTVLLPFPIEDLEQVAEVLGGVDVRVPQRGTQHQLVQLADQNARHLMESFRIESFEADERSADPVYALARDLGLATVPRSMVCVDISTNQGRDTVGSLVWFEGGRPRKAEYRKFRIRGEGMQDDFAAIHEVVTRYVTRRRAEDKPLPDLMIIDGGKGQLGAARAALEDAGVKLQLASIAKREEEIYLPERAEPIRLQRSAPSLRLVQRIRDEAHRFAIEYNRNRRKARTFESALLSIRGVGPTRRRALLERFGSLAGVRLATVDEIASVPGFSRKLAERVLEDLSR